MEPKPCVTLQRVAALAAGLRRWRSALAVVAVGSAAWFVGIVVDTDTAGEGGLVPLTLLMWSALGLGVAFTLPLLPAPVAPDDGFWCRLRKRCLQAGYALAVLVMLGLALFSLWLTLRAIGI